MKLFKLYTIYIFCYTYIITTSIIYLMKAGDYVPSGIQVTKAALDDFKKIQTYMLLAKKENATETYAELKKEYLTIKALLNVSGVNMTDIDIIKE